jgi:hypothetical protein
MDDSRKHLLNAPYIMYMIERESSRPLFPRMLSILNLFVFILGVRKHLLFLAMVVLLAPLHMWSTLNSLLHHMFLALRAVVVTAPWSRECFILSFACARPWSVKSMRIVVTLLRRRARWDYLVTLTMSSRSLMIPLQNGMLKTHKLLEKRKNPPLLHLLGPLGLHPVGPAVRVMRKKTLRRMFPSSNLSTTMMMITRRMMMSTCFGCCLSFSFWCLLPKGSERDHYVAFWCSYLKTSFQFPKLIFVTLCGLRTSNVYFVCVRISCEP